MLGLAAPRGWALHCSHSSFCELSAAFSAESSSQRPLLHPYVHNTITQTLLPFRHWRRLVCCNFIFKFLESSEQVPGSSEILGPLCLAEIYSRDIFGFDLAPDYFWKPFSSHMRHHPGKDKYYRWNSAVWKIPSMQMLVRHKKDAGSNLIFWKVGESFFILENISWLLTIVPGWFHANMYSCCVDLCKLSMRLCLH